MTRPGSTPEGVRARVCGDKVRHPDIGAARAHARHLNRQTPTAGFAPYPCPFCHAWHAGHVPSLESLQELALVMRGLPLEPPQPHDPPARQRRRRPKKEKTMPAPDTVDDDQAADDLDRLPQVSVHHPLELLTVLASDRARDAIARAVRRHDTHRLIAGHDMDALAGTVQAELLDLLDADA